MMPYNREQIYCVFCGNNTKETGRIQFNEDGKIIGCCEPCLKLAELFVKCGRAVKPSIKNVVGDANG